MDTELERAWRTLHDHLDARARSLAAEVRGYPTPIARCDDQLPGLIAQRTDAYAALHEAEALARDEGALGAGGWRSRMAAFVSSLPSADPTGLALAAQLIRAADSAAPVPTAGMTRPAAPR